MHKAIISGKVLACHDVSEGGLIITIFEMCVGGNCGVEIKVDGKRLLSETAGCFIVEVENEKMAKRLFKGIPYKILGKTIKDEKLIVEDLFTADVNKLQKAWQKPMKEVFG